MRLAIIGAGPAGIMAGINALENVDELVFFDKDVPLKTLLPTGGGRCNLAYGEFDNNELVKFYPRGSKFLLSVFSRFSTADTLEFFEKIGVKSYIQDDLRIFPCSNSSKDVRKKLLSLLNDTKVKFYCEEVLSFKKVSDRFRLKTNKSEYFFDKVIFAGGIRDNFDVLKESGINIIAPKPALCALCIEDVSLYSLSGVSFKDVIACIDGSKQEFIGDFIITQNSISGPLVYKISSANAFSSFPYQVRFNFVGYGFDEFDMRLRELLDNNSKKLLINIISEFIPKSFAQFLFKKNAVSFELKASQVNRAVRTMLAKEMTEYKMKIVAQKPNGEIVSAGGVNLDLINPKSMEYKDISGLYFCGEVLNIDGYTGGFNLQNCWSTGYLAGTAVAKGKKN